ncbi:AAA family ATPase [Candidatus Rariloculus sp.]|uniref:AAA family ATPase n=1 Tax=Candidatus Rariloculus sp. TaxID=3101265 RepID=UPI003D0C247F
MKLKTVEIENYRAIDKMRLPLHPSLIVFHGDNAHGKTSVLSAIAVGLGAIPSLLPEVSGIGFRKTDPRQRTRPMRIALEATDGTAWGRRWSGGGNEKSYARKAMPIRQLREKIYEIIEADRDGRPIDLPIVAFYDTDRAVFDRLPRSRRSKTEFPRYFALQDALSRQTNFGDFLKWFYAKENEELREQREWRDFDERLLELESVRKAIESMVPGVSEPRVKLKPLRFAVTVRDHRGKKKELALDQLSGGFRIMLALAADLARRMAQGNPHLDDPLTSEAIVLIDEVELHLHPSWQQRILTDLTRTFPNTQFIVSTHSPQVLSDIHPEQIVELIVEKGRIVARNAAAPTYGAEAGDVLVTVMGVDERPPRNEFAKALKRYMGLINDGKGETKAARTLRKDLDQMSPNDPGLERADMELRRRKMVAGRSASR